MTACTQTPPALPVIAGVEITTDAEGRFNLYALHCAWCQAKGITPAIGRHNAPDQWFRSQQAKNLIAEMNSQTANSQPALKINNGGKNPSAFAHELLAVSYASWISPGFQLQVTQCFLDYKAGRLQPTTQEEHLTLDDKLRIAGSCLDLATRYGFEGNQARLSADRASQSLINFSPLKAMGQEKLIAENKEKAFIPAELGKMRNPTITAQEVNQRLKKAGLQEKLAGEWNPTEKGKAFCEVVDTTQAQSSGRPVKQILWYPSAAAHWKQEPEPETAPTQQPEPQSTQSIYTQRKKPIKRKSRGRWGLYALDNYYSLRELAQTLGILFGEVTKKLLDKGIIEVSARYKSNNKYILTKEGWKVGAMYDPSDQMLYTEPCGKALISNARVVFTDDIITFF